ncbi:MAG: chloride channel protein [Cyanobacteriota bacterium]|nr:chloride channel protein [Cyanobacteriota bacterium]
MQPEHEQMGTILSWAGAGWIGGLIGSLAAVALTELIKLSLGAAAGLGDLWTRLLPLLGIALAMWILFGVGRGQPAQTIAPRGDTAVAQERSLTSWYSFPHDIARADLTGDVVNASGAEERFPWTLAPLRALAILATVGLGAPMGTESPAAHIGVATGSWLGNVVPVLRPLARPLAIGGGAASVSALIGIPLVGSCFMFELAQRRQIPLTPQRAASMLAGGLCGWGVNRMFHLNLIRLVVPTASPAGFLDAVEATVCVGVVAGTLTALTGEAIYWARGWRQRPVARLLLGGGVLLVLALLIGWLATPAAALGPGGAAIGWAESNDTAPLQLLALAALRAGATTAAVLAGGCGGVFVPFLAIGDLSGRMFAEPFGLPPDLAGAAGAAAGVAGGYRLPLTALAMVLGVGGPDGAKLTCMATVVVAALTGLVAARAANGLSTWVRARLWHQASQEE